MASNRRRYVVRTLLGVLVAGGLMLAAVPWWWPVAVEQVNGVSIRRVVTHGWSTVELRDVQVSRNNLEVSAGFIRLPAFGYWPGGGPAATVLADNVTIRVLPRPRDARSPSPSATRLVQSVLDLWPALRRWVPAGYVRRLRVLGNGPGSVPVTCDEVLWDGESLRVRARVPGREEKVLVFLRRDGDRTLVLSARAPGWGARLQTRAAMRDGRLHVESTLDWRGNEVRSSAQFGRDGLIPRHGTLAGGDLAVPANQLGLPGYGTISGGIDATWNGHGYAARVQARARPTDAAADLPPLEVDLDGSGNLAHVRIDAAKIQVPGVHVDLSAPFTISLRRGVPSTPALLKFAIDLAKLPAIAATGRVDGRIELTGATGNEPGANVAFEGARLQWRGGTVRSLRVQGRWTPDRFELRQAAVRVGDDSQIQGKAVFDLRQGRITRGSVELDVAAAAIEPWLPTVPKFRRVVANLTAHGSWAQPRHEGAATLQQFAGLPGGPLDAQLKWQGRGSRSVAVEGDLKSVGGVSVPFAASFSRPDAKSLDVAVTKLSWDDAQGEWWHLAKPVQASVADQHVTIDQLQLTGPEVGLTLAANAAWPGWGEVKLEARGVDAGRLAPLLGREIRGARLGHLQVQAGWDHGPVRLAGTLQAACQAAKSSSYQVAADFRSENGRLVLGSIKVADQDGLVMQGAGRLPLQLQGDDDGLVVRLPRDEALALDLDSTPNAGFWQAFTTATGWKVESPAVHARLEGTLAAPQGRIEATVQTLQPPPNLAEGVRWPEISELDLVAVATAEGVRVTRGITKFDGNWVSLSGQFPWSAAREMREAGGVPWRNLQFTFAADRLPMTIASRALPRVFAPDGTLSFEIKHTPAQGFDGFIWLDHLGVRPIPPLGSVREVEGRVLLDGYQLTLRQVAAFLGGRPVELGGRADLVNPGDPVFDLRLLSSGVPLVRQQGLVLRAGLDLRVQRQAGQPALVSGSAQLGRSVFVSDLVEVLPTGGSVQQPERRPPYFSVPVAPFADWRLDVALQGDDFLEIKSPFFRAGVSADFKLAGTLREPRAVGRAWTDAGSIIFPFGNLEVQHAEVSLSPDQPDALALRATAATRLYGYNLRLDISGTTQDPRLQFTSEPPLSSQQVFLMLTAGELPDADNTFTTSERAQRLGWFVARNLAAMFGLGAGEGGEKLTVRSGEDFSREGSETIYVQYDLDDHWSVVGEKDRFDEYNAGIKYRIIER